MLFEMPRHHSGVAGYSLVIVETLSLPLARSHDAVADRGRAFLRALTGNVSIFDGRHFDVQIDAIEQRSRDSLTITLYLNRTATAFSFQIAKVAARARIHCCNEHEFRWKSDTASGARHRDFSILERLAHHFQRRPFELGQLIEKEDTVVGEAHFTGVRKCAATEKSNVTDGVMRIAERSRRDKRLFSIEQTGDAMNLRRLNRFIQGERRNDGWNALGQH